MSISEIYKKSFKYSLLLSIIIFVFWLIYFFFYRPTALGTPEGNITLSFVLSIGPFFLSYVTFFSMIYRKYNKGKNFFTKFLLILGLPFIVILALTPPILYLAVIPSIFSVLLCGVLLVIFNFFIKY